MRKVSFMLVGMMMGAAVVLSACNTVAGAGRDVSATGAAVSNSATAAKSTITHQP